MRSDNSGRRERTRPGILVCVLCAAVVREGLPLFICVCTLPITPPASLRSHGSRPRPTRHIPPSPLAGRGVPTRLRSTPPLPPLLGGARQGGRGVPGGKDRRGERKGDGRMRSDRDERGEREKKKISVRFPDTLPLGPQPAERFTRGAMRWYWTSLVDGPMLSRLLADGGGSSGRGQPAASRPFPAPPQTWRMAAGFGLQVNGATPPLPLGRQPPLLDPGARQRVFRPTCSSIAPAPPLRAATGGLRYFLLPDLLSTAIPLSSEGSLTACASFLPGFGHQCNAVDIYGKKEAGTGEHLTHLIIK